MSKSKSVVILVIIISIGVYLSIPTPGFPPPPPGSLKSSEPADSESIYRKSFYTNLSRSEITNYYSRVFSPNLKLNHPPEFGVTYIRDQTRSSWLEEFVHIGKDSLYINGFYPTKPTEQININGTQYAAKITIRYIPSSLISRLTIIGLVSVAIIWLIKEYERI